MDPTTLGLRYAALSDVGRVRRDNQDSGFASEHLLVVADGVGGAARGDIASATTLSIMRRLDAPAPEDAHEALAGAVHRAHDRLAELVEQDPELEGTSTTLTAALFDGTKFSMAHLGDSRGYLFRDGTLAQLTKDHTFVQTLIDEGRITEDEARTHPHRNLILRALDAVRDAEPDLFDVEVAPGDRLLLCSDGCSGVLDEARLADILGTGSVDYAVVELVRASLEAGSSDNVTCVVADVVDPATEEAPLTSGPVVVGSAAEQPRRAGAVSRSFFRGHRGGDTGELEPVPGTSTDTADATDLEELRYAPRPPRRFVWFRRVAALLVVVAILVVAGVFGYRWTQGQYYVAADASHVAIFRGVAADVPGLRMHQVAKRTKVTLQSLGDYPAERVRNGIDASSYADAKNIVRRLTSLARKCPSPSPSPTPSASLSPTRSASHKASSSTSPTAQSTRHKRRHQRASTSPKPGRPSSSASAAPSTPTAPPSPTLKPPDCITGATR
ncbi:MAG TPA: protein phosphatase 2C domain-containing protein [Nocardioidaceae bacterium]|nr:protein phosphatase 2C domain-containing protein [Nocardioidaceae bacterium]